MFWTDSRWVRVHSQILNCARTSKDEHGVKASDKVNDLAVEAETSALKRLLSFELEWLCHLIWQIVYCDSMEKARRLPCELFHILLNLLNNSAVIGEALGLPWVNYQVQHRSAGEPPPIASAKMSTEYKGLCRTPVLSIFPYTQSGIELKFLEDSNVHDVLELRVIRSLTSLSQQTAD